MRKDKADDHEKNHTKAITEQKAVKHTFYTDQLTQQRLIKDYARTVGERFQWTLRVFSNSPRPTLAAIGVALDLAMHFNAARGCAWPGQRRIAEQLRLDRRNVARGIKWLLDQRLIEKIRQGNKARSDAYVLVITRDLASIDGLQLGSLPADRSTAAFEDAEGRPHKAAPEPPKQVSRSESVGIPHYRAAQARSAKAPRAGGASNKSARLNDLNINPNFRL